MNITTQGNTNARASSWLFDHVDAVTPGGSTVITEEGVDVITEDGVLVATES